MSGFWSNLSNFLVALLVAKNLQKQSDETNLKLPDGEAGFVRSDIVSLNPTHPNNPISDLDKEKLEIEKAKILIEREKIDLERDKLIVTTFLEDFKARWQELLNFENENSRWQTLYVTALVLVVAWILSNSGEGAGCKYKNIADIFKGDNSFLLLSLALINAIYTLAMAYKGYQVQEIAQYLYKEIGTIISRKALSDKALAEFNTWEKWRRDERGKPVFIRRFYYIIIGILPTAVSVTILVLYFYYGYLEYEYQARSRLNFFAYSISFFVVMTLLAALWTAIKMNSEWTRIFAEEDDKKAN